jgi:hypothetical protein
MAPYGEIVGWDVQGNAKVRPKRGRRMVILSDSRFRNYLDSQEVFYDETFPGRHVDFADVHYPVNSSGCPLGIKVRGLDETGMDERQQEPFKILRAAADPKD